MAVVSRTNLTLGYIAQRSEELELVNKAFAQIAADNNQGFDCSLGVVSTDEQADDTVVRCRKKSYVRGLVQRWGKRA